MKASDMKPGMLFVAHPQIGRMFPQFHGSVFLVLSNAGEKVVGVNLAGPQVAGIHLAGPPKAGPILFLHKPYRKQTLHNRPVGETGYVTTRINIGAGLFLAGLGKLVYRYRWVPPQNIGTVLAGRVVWTHEKLQNQFAAGIWRQPELGVSLGTLLVIPPPLRYEFAIGGIALRGTRAQA